LTTTLYEKVGVEGDNYMTRSWTINDT